MYPSISSPTFDEDEGDREVVDGNIMPFDTSTSEALETWLGHSNPTVALAVVSGAQFTCFTVTQVRILTPEELRARKIRRECRSFTTT
jgi:hypothetical protein